MGGSVGRVLRLFPQTSAGEGTGMAKTGTATPRRPRAWRECTGQTPGQGEQVMELSVWPWLLSYSRG